VSEKGIAIMVRCHYDSVTATTALSDKAMSVEGMFRHLGIPGMVTVTLLVLTNCGVLRLSTPFIRAEPEVDSVVSVAPRTLRLYYQQLPDVSKSTVTLSGPEGRMLELRGLHTMGADDLMMEINDQLEDGSYTVSWKTVVGADPNEYEGWYSFEVRRN
jgi:methionine-rich copper-binding protein CopC